MGGKFWLALIGGIIACGVAAFLGFLLITGFWYRWGFIATFALITGIALFAGWLSDRRNARRDGAY
ncbi:MAG TPA: hypothetical protein VFY02_10445 [Gaiellaceae bacterium]|jgi:hypothetical protein|nr:hypothetical protein [Gaiellaceae bacterium]